MNLRLMQRASQAGMGLRQPAAGRHLHMHEPQQCASYCALHSLACMLPSSSPDDCCPPAAPLDDVAAAKLIKAQLCDGVQVTA